MKQAGLFLVATALLLCICGCAALGRTTPEQLAGQTYVYEKEGFGGDFYISFAADGTFRYSEGLLSSHIGMGKWHLEGDSLCLTEENVAFIQEDGTCITKTVSYVFAIHKNEIVFLEDNVSNFGHVKVAGGDRFLLRE